MNKYEIMGNDGKILDIIYGIDIIEAIDFCQKNELPNSNILDLGPARLTSWAEVAA